MTWVPYIPDVEKWTKHFKLMAQGKLQPTRNGMYIVGDQQGGVQEPEVRINYVTPTEAAVSRAKSQLKREREESDPSKVYKKRQTLKKPKSKLPRKKSIKGRQKTKPKRDKLT